jgi:hypothetical protein
MAIFLQGNQPALLRAPIECIYKYYYALDDEDSLSHLTTFCVPSITLQIRALSSA